MTSSVPAFAGVVAQTKCLLLPIKALVTLVDVSQVHAQVQAQRAADNSAQVDAAVQQLGATTSHG